MAKLPVLQAPRTVRGSVDDSVVFAVYAPFGTDEILSVYPNAAQAPVRKQALVQQLQKVAAQGVNVSCLIDLFEDDSYLIEIAANDPKGMRVHSVWKQDMSAPQALAGFLRRTRFLYPRSTLVLALEGHGGGFVPDIDPARITPTSATRWSSGGQSGEVHWVKTEDGTSFEPEGGSPVLPMTSPELPMTSPELPAVRMPMSTWGLGAALRSALKSGVPRPAVIHFNNCFNASVELLHTIAPYAGYATGYANYDYFTAGQSYPAVFAKLKAAGSATAEQIARWFAADNEAVLLAKRNHPAVGATIALARMKPLAAAIDRLAQALTAALRPANPADRPAVLNLVRQSAVAAQHYDTEVGFELAVPDQLVDLASFAAQLQARFPAGAVDAAAGAVVAAAAGVWQFGDFDRPWLDETQIWDFRSQQLGLNILLPDPALQGVWDWRSPYYLSGTVDPTKPPAHRHVIDFLANRPARPPWVEFIVEYHRDVKFVRLAPARAPLFPIFNADYKPTLPHPGNDGPIPGTPR